MNLKKKKRPSNPLKPSTRSKVRKGPARDEKHLQRVRAQYCIISPTITSFATEAHHVRCIGPRTLGKRVSDYLTVPMCASCHRALHSMGEKQFWRENHLDPADWIRAFSKEGRQAIAALRSRT